MHIPHQLRTFLLYVIKGTVDPHPRIHMMNGSFVPNFTLLSQKERFRPKSALLKVLLSTVKMDFFIRISAISATYFQAIAQISTSIAMCSSYNRNMS